MAVDCAENFSLNDVLKEFLNLFEECCVNNDPASVPVKVLVDKIASSVQIQSFAGSSGDLENLLMKILMSDCQSSHSDVGHPLQTQMLSRDDFVSKITKYIAKSDIGQESNIRLNFFHGNGTSGWNNHVGIISNCLDVKGEGENDLSVEELVEEKQRLEILCSNLQERLEMTKKENTSLAIEINGLRSSFRDATKRESDWEQTIVQLQSKLNKSEDNNRSLAIKLLNEEEIFKREKEKCLNLQQQLNLNGERITMLSRKLVIANDENQRLQPHIEELEKKLESLNNQFVGASNSLDLCRSEVVTLQEKLYNTTKRNEVIETQLENTLHKLRLVTFLHEDLEMANNLLKDKLSRGSEEVEEEKEQLSQDVVGGLGASYDESKDGFGNCWSEGEMIAEYTSTPLAATGSHLNIPRHRKGAAACDEENKSSIWTKKSLRDEIKEVEGEPECSMVGCYLIDDEDDDDEEEEAERERFPLFMKKIERQQLVMKHLAETISKYSTDGGCDEISNSASYDAKRRTRSRSDSDDRLLSREESPHPVALALVQKVCHGCPCVRSAGCESSSLFHHLGNGYCQIGDCETSSLIHFSWAEHKYHKSLSSTGYYSSSSSSSTCSNHSSEKEENMLPSDNPIHYSVDDDVSAHQHKLEKEDDGLPSSYCGDEIACDSDAVSLISDDSDYHWPLVSRSAVAVETKENFVTKKITGKREAWLSSNFSISSTFVIVLMLVAMAWLFGINYNFFRKPTYYKSASFRSRPINYYSIEELLQPYVKLRWHQPPPI